MSLLTVAGLASTQFSCGEDELAKASFQPETEFEPVTPSVDEQVCAQIEDLSGSCPLENYDCSARPERQSACYLELLLLIRREQGDVCLFFDEEELLCFDGQPTTDAFFSCALQECLELAEIDTCLERFEQDCALGGF